MKSGKVSIIVPCYNQAKFLSETLDSVLSQTYPNWECVIINDGSIDNTEEVANKFLVKDARFKYLWQKKGGPSRARNFGIWNSCGEFILPLDADDLIAPTYLEKAVAYLSSFPETKLVYCKANKFGIENGYWDLEDYDYGKFIWNNCIFCTAMFKRADYDRTNGYNENMIYGNEDWDFWLSLLKKNDVVHRIEEVLFYYRIKRASRTTELNEEKLQKMLAQMCNNHPDVYLPYFDKIIFFHNYGDDYDNNIGPYSVLREDLERIRSSYAYRFGKFVLKPFSWLRNKISF